ncbi:Bzip transcription factor [Phytophthora megakarya]|uniref:Bzip transcription factor n=1 Tax=Phytophthora megakarya TaxID=4795 RepID=A0A225WU23_9STRA|nr:Bzip transcription factor [Phytophthora megakarya]
MELKKTSPPLGKLQDINNQNRTQLKLTRRDQCRINQARYRIRQRNAQLELEMNVKQLQQELKRMKRRYQDLTPKKNKQSPWSIVAEVFRLLQNSFRLPWYTQKLNKHSDTRQILVLLERAFAPDVAMGEVRGVDVLMHQLRLYSLHFGSPSLRLKGVKSLGPGILTATAHLSLAVTEITLKHVFPRVAVHVPAFGDGGPSCLYQRLLLQRLTCTSSLTFLFEEGRVGHLETSIDLCTPLLRVLGNIKGLSEVLQHSRFTTDYTIGALSD